MSSQVICPLPKQAVEASQIQRLWKGQRPSYKSPHVTLTERRFLFEQIRLDLLLLDVSEEAIGAGRRSVRDRASGSEVQQAPAVATPVGVCVVLSLSRQTFRAISDRNSDRTVCVPSKLPLCRHTYIGIVQESSLAAEKKLWSGLSQRSWPARRTSSISAISDRPLDTGRSVSRLDGSALINLCCLRRDSPGHERCHTQMANIPNSAEDIVLNSDRSQFFSFVAVHPTSTRRWEFSHKNPNTICQRPLKVTQQGRSHRFSAAVCEESPSRKSSMTTEKTNSDFVPVPSPKDRRLFAAVRKFHSARLASMEAGSFRTGTAGRDFGFIHGPIFIDGLVKLIKYLRTRPIVKN